MAGLFAKLTGALGGLLDDPKKLDSIISAGFGAFDKDKSGYIDAKEAKACAQKVIALAGVKEVKDSHFDAVFNKMAGADKKMDKAEFTKLVQELLKKTQQDKDHKDGDKE